MNKNMIKNFKVFALILLTSALLLVAIIPNVPSVKAATTDSVTVFSAVGGTTTPAGNSTGPYASYTYASGSTQTFTATAGTGFIFLCWETVTSSGATTSTTNPLSYTVSQATAIQALFIPTSSAVTTTPTPTTIPSKYTVSVFSSVGGTTTPSGISTTAPYSTYTYASGSTQTFTATAGTGFKLLCWEIVTGNGPTTSTTNPLSYAVSQTTALQALFIPTSSTVTLPTPTPTPKINEFSSAAAIITVLALVIVAFGTYAYTKKAKK